MVIGFAGKKNAGKNSAANWLTMNYDFEQLSFAAKGKQVACYTLGCNMEELEEFKNDPEVKVLLLGPFNDSTGMHEPAVEMTVREFLQRLLNDGMKSAYGQLFHVNQILPLDFDHVGFKYCVTDVRFSFEALRIRELGGFVIEVQRPNLDSADKHVSENPLPSNLIDYLLVNDSDFDTLHKRLDSIIDDIAERMTTAYESS